MSVASADIRERVHKAVSSQKRPTVTVLSSLLAAQDELGYLPDDAIEEIATYRNTTINEVWGVASFYTNFRFTPPGEHKVEVCWGPTCHLAGAPNIVRALQDKLGLSGEGETADGRITLKYNTCLGACSQPPVVSVDHHLSGRLTTESAESLIADLRNMT